jgi:signal transduction histidine kinase
MPQPKRTADEDVSQRTAPCDRAISDFLLRVCHDLRSPLRAIRAHAELLLKDGASPQTASLERLGFIVNGAREIELLVDGLARYSIALQIEEASFQSTPMEVVLRAVLSKLDKEIRDHGAQVSYHTLPRVWGNPDRLMEVFENLIRNALLHGGPASPRIHIAAEKNADSWVFAIRDNGPGVETGYLQTIFQPFERLHGKDRPGAGLGLAICRAIVEQHGGKIWAESEPDKGATFFFALPAP